MAGVVLLKNPIEPNLPEYEVVPFKSKKYLLYPLDYMSLNFEFSGPILRKYESYSEKKVFATFITLDELENPVQSSEVFTNRD